MPSVSSSYPWRTLARHHHRASLARGRAYSRKARQVYIRVYRLLAFAQGIRGISNLAVYGGGLAARFVTIFDPPKKLDFVDEYQHCAHHGAHSCHNYHYFHTRMNHLGEFHILSFRTLVVHEVQCADEAYPRVVRKCLPIRI